VFAQWRDCEAQIQYFPHPIYRKFGSYEDAVFFSFHEPPLQSPYDPPFQNREAWRSIPFSKRANAQPRDHDPSSSHSKSVPPRGSSSSPSVPHLTSSVPTRNDFAPVPRTRDGKFAPRKSLGRDGIMLHTPEPRLEMTPQRKESQGLMMNEDPQLQLELLKAQAKSHLESIKSLARVFHVRKNDLLIERFPHMNTGDLVQGRNLFPDTDRDSDYDRPPGFAHLHYVMRVFPYSTENPGPTVVPSLHPSPVHHSQSSVVPQSSPVPQFASVSESSKCSPLPSTPFGSQVRTAESQSLDRALFKRRDLQNIYQSEVLREGDIFVDLKT